MTKRLSAAEIAAKMKTKQIPQTRAASRDTSDREGPPWWATIEAPTEVAVPGTAILFPYATLKPKMSQKGNVFYTGFKGSSSITAWGADETQKAKTPTLPDFRLTIAGKVYNPDTKASEYTKGGEFTALWYTDDNKTTLRGVLNNTAGTKAERNVTNIMEILVAHVNEDLDMEIFTFLPPPQSGDARPARPSAPARRHETDSADDEEQEEIPF